MFLYSTPMFCDVEGQLLILLYKNPVLGLVPTSNPKIANLAKSNGKLLFLKPALKTLLELLNF